MQLNLIKLGGSVITRSGPSALFADNLGRLAEELRAHAGPTVLIHGTGHVGKPWAIEHGFLREGIVPAAKPALAADIAADLIGLNEAVVACLREAGIDARGVRPADFFGEDMHTPRSPDRLRSLHDTLASGATPVFHGDLMPLADGGHRVFSSDAMAAGLSELLAPAHMLFLSDVDGVFPPGVDGGHGTEPLAAISAADLDRIYRDAGDRHDVSGGMSAKVEHALRAAGHAGRCTIGNGLRPGRLEALLNGVPAPCTEVRTVAGTR